MTRSQARADSSATLLKADVFGRVERIQNGSTALIRRTACGSAIPFSRLIARRLLARERTALEHLADVDGIPRIHDPSQPNTLVRAYIAGAPLSAARELPENFFEELDALVESLHAHGVCHNDLHKEQNILVSTDGRPWLVDFQLASLHPHPSRTFRTRAREDLRHIEKHRRRYTRDGRGPHGQQLFGRGTGQRRSPLARLWRRTAKPLYNAFIHSLLRRPPSEARRESTGPWPRWIAAVEPRAITQRQPR